MDLKKNELEGLSLALDEATLLSVCLDRTLWQANVLFEVLTLPEDDLPPKDRTVSFILSRIVRIAAALSKTADGGSKRLDALPLELDGLEEAVKSFNGVPIYGADFIRKNGVNDAPNWFPYASFDVRNDIENGTVYTLDLFQVASDRSLDMRFWFQDLQIKKNEKLVDLKEFIEGGKRWWEALKKNSYRTEGSGIIPLKDQKEDEPPKPDQQ